METGKYYIKVIVMDVLFLSFFRFVCCGIESLHVKKPTKSTFLFLTFVYFLKLSERTSQNQSNFIFAYFLDKNHGFDCSIASRCLFFLMFATFLVIEVTCIGMESGKWQVLH